MSLAEFRLWGGLALIVAGAAMTAGAFRSQSGLGIFGGVLMAGIGAGIMGGG
jgi:hypothetical protein